VVILDFLGGIHRANQVGRAVTCEFRVAGFLAEEVRPHIVNLEKGGTLLNNVKWVTGGSVRACHGVRRAFSAVQAFNWVKETFLTEMASRLLSIAF